MPVDINDGDEISRCIIYDRAFDHDVHVDALLWRFEGAKGDGASHESAVLRRLAPETDDVHRIGCNIASHQNQRKNNPPPGKARRYYCGFRTASYASLPKQGNGYRISFVHAPEGGEEAHVDVALTILVEGKSAKAVRRTDAGLALAERFGPPTPFCCECDLQDDQHPFAIWGADCLTAGIRDRWPDLVFSVGDEATANDDDPPQLGAG